MKKRSKPKANDELRPEYDLRQLLRHGERGKYAARCRQGTNLVLLDPAIALAFPTDAAVNDALRLVLRLADIPATAEAGAAKRRGRHRRVTAFMGKTRPGREPSSAELDKAIHGR